jgi:hypothetical protein
MRLEMSGFIRKDHFDLNSYLTYLFNKLNEHPKKEGIVSGKAEGKSEFE